MFLAFAVAVSDVVVGVVVVGTPFNLAKAIPKLLTIRKAGKSAEAKTSSFRKMRPSHVSWESESRISRQDVQMLPAGHKVYDRGRPASHQEICIFYVRITSSALLGHQASIWQLYSTG